MKIVLRTHMAIVLSMEKVFLRGLEHPDYVVTLHREADEDGTAKRPVEMTMRRLMMLVKVNGIWLWRFICPTSDGGWCGYYASGKVSNAHRLLAEGWAGSAAAHVRFKCLARGIVQRDISRLLRQSFSLSACREGERARYVNGVIVSEQHASMLAIGNKIKHCKWVDNGATYSKAAPTKASEQHVRAPLDNNSHAYTFTAQESVGGDTFAHSLLNPETGRVWEEGEKEQHLQAAIEGAKAAVEGREEDKSIASDESAGWEQNAVFEFEGMDGIQNPKVVEIEAEQETETEIRKSEMKDLSKELRETLLASGRLNSDKDQHLGQDMQQLMRAAIKALKASQSSPTATHGRHKLDKGNTGEDRQATDQASGGQGP